MFSTDLLLAELGDWVKWYHFVILGVLIIALVAYKIQQKKMM